MTRKEFVKSMYVKTITLSIFGYCFLAIGATVLFAGHYYAAILLSVLSGLCFRESKRKLNEARALRILMELRK